MIFNLKSDATTWVRTCFLRADLCRFKAAVKSRQKTGLATHEVEEQHVPGSDMRDPSPGDVRVLPALE